MKNNLKINMLSGVIFQISIQLSPLIIFPHLVKTLTVAEFGYFSFFWAICQYFILIVEYGFNLTAIQDASRTDNLKKLFTCIVYSRLILFAGCSLLFFISCFYTGYSVERNLIFIGFLLQVLSTVFLNQWVFRFYEKIHLLLIPALVNLILTPVLIYFMVQEPTDSYVAALVQGGVSLLISIMSLVIINRTFNLKFIPVNVRDVIATLKKSFSIFIANFSFGLYAVSPPIILGIISNVSEVALFSAASKVRAAGVGFLLPVSNVLYVTIGKIIKNKETEKTMKIIVFFTALCFAVSISIYYAANIIVTYLMGESYYESVMMIEIFSAIIFFVSMNSFLSQSLFLSYGYKNIYTKISLICCLIYLIVFYPLISNFGALGTVFTILIVESISFLIISYNIKKLRLLSLS